MTEELKLVQKSYDLCQWMFNHTNRFPKSHRFSIAVKIENLFLDFLEEVSLANYRHKKLPLLQLADGKLFRIRLMIRLSHSMKFIRIMFNHKPEVGLPMPPVYGPAAGDRT